jgi:queuine/archaeosine tRNA-ribosyltransferase
MTEYMKTSDQHLTCFSHLLVRSLLENVCVPFVYLLASIDFFTEGSSNVLINYQKTASLYLASYVNLVITSPLGPRYAMGVGFAEDLLVCVALGVDMVRLYPGTKQHSLIDHSGRLCLPNSYRQIRCRIDAYGAH